MKQNTQPTIDTLRNQAAILRQKVSEAVNNYIENTGKYPILNFSKPERDIETTTIIISPEKVFS